MASSMPWQYFYLLFINWGLKINNYFYIVHVDFDTVFAYAMS